MRDASGRHITGTLYDEDELGLGLGDRLAGLIQRTGLDKLAHAYTSATGQDCGCAARQEALNRFGEKVKENLVSLRRLR